jgi:hypothetical protein
MQISKNTSKQISNELRLLITKKQKVCVTDAEKNNAVNSARAEINRKYGKDWRLKYDTNKKKDNSDLPSIYDGHINGEHWMD